MNAMAPDNIVWKDLSRYSSPIVPSRFSYMTQAEEARVESIRQRRLLFRGRHREFFVGEARTQFPIATLLVNGRERGIYVPYNLLGLISRKGADLLFGEHPRISSDDAAIQSAIDDIQQQSHMRRVLFEAAVTCSWAGEAFLEVTTGDKGQAYISTPTVDEIFPVGDILPNGQYAEYRRYATADIGPKDKPITLLLITTYRAGEIQRELWQLEKGKKLKSFDTLESWPPFKGKPPLVLEHTGLEQCSIVWIPNEVIEGQAVSDYELPLIELQDLVNSKQSQLARVLAIHSNPRMFFPSGAVDNDGNIRVAAEAFFGDNKDAKPEYIEMVGKPDAAMADRDFAVAALCVSAEMTPELLGIKHDAAADSARKMRLAASSPLAKTERRTAYWQPAIQLVMTIAVRVQLNRPIDQLAVGVELRDGLPNDEAETADTIASLRTADLLSDERGLQMLGLDPAAIQEEINRLQEKRKAQTPSVLLGEPNVAGNVATDQGAGAPNPAA